MLAYAGLPYALAAYRVIVVALLFQKRPSCQAADNGVTYALFSAQPSSDEGYAPPMRYKNRADALRGAWILGSTVLDFYRGLVAGLAVKG